MSLVCVPFEYGSIPRLHPRVFNVTDIFEDIFEFVFPGFGIALGLGIADRDGCLQRETGYHLDLLGGDRAHALGVGDFDKAEEVIAGENGDHREGRDRLAFGIFDIDRFSCLDDAGEGLSVD